MYMKNLETLCLCIDIVLASFYFFYVPALTSLVKIVNAKKKKGRFLNFLKKYLIFVLNFLKWKKIRKLW